MSIHEIYNIFEQLKADSSRTAKERILQENQGNELFKYTLGFLYDTNIVTGLSSKKISKTIVDLEVLEDHNFNEIEDAMEYVKENNTGTGYNIVVVQNFIDKLESPDHKEFARQIFIKKLKCGLTKNTINKIYGEDFIDAFGVLLAESYKDYESKVVGKYFASVKLDGVRGIAIKENDQVKFLTRKGKDITGMVDIEEQYKKLPNGYVYDGELLLINSDNLTTEELFRATKKVVATKGVKKNLQHHIFDMLPIEEFNKGKSSKTYEQRRNTLDIFEKQYMTELDLVKVIPTLYEGSDKQMIAVLMKWAMEKGLEGLIVRVADGLYERKRSTNLLRIKEFKTADLLVISMDMAVEGQFKGLMGRVNVAYKDTLVGVGSGFSREQRKQFTKNPDEIIGKIIEVQYFEESKDEKTGLLSLRLPIFKGIRDDKGVGDVNYG